MNIHQSTFSLAHSLTSAINELFKGFSLQSIELLPKKDSIIYAYKLQKQKPILISILISQSDENDFYAYVLIKKHDNELIVNDYVKKVLGKGNSIFESNGEQSLEEFSYDVFNYLKKLFNNELKAVVEDKEWIDIPFDWHGYK